MSIDYDAVCDTCRLVVHAGQIMAGTASFGYASGDAEGRSAVADWCFEHARHGAGVRLEVSDVAERRPSDDYERVEL